MSFEGFLAATLPEKVTDSADMATFIFNELAGSGAQITDSSLSAYFTDSGMTRDEATSTLNSCREVLGPYWTPEKSLRFEEFRKCVRGPVPFS